MNRIIKHIFVLALPCLLLFSCQNEGCVVGNWEWVNSEFICPTKLTFYGDNTGTLIYTDCGSTCPGGSTASETRYNFTWSLVNDTALTLTFSASGMRCGNSYTFQGGEALGIITGTMQCGDLIEYENSRGNWELQRL